MGTKKTGTEVSGGIRVVYFVLLGVLILLGLSLLAGTVYALAVRNDAGLSPDEPQNRGGGISPQDSLSPDAEGQTFMGIGQIRAATAPPGPAAVIFSVTFPYNPEDRVFAEELASRTGDFRQSASEYLGSLSAERLRALDEGAVKAELLRRYNSLLRLGRIEVLYFSDFMILE
jgi:hypothetical protein